MASKALISGSHFKLPPPKCGQRLIPTLIDEIASSDPKRTFVIVTRTTDPAIDLVEISFQQVATAINGCAWWLDARLGRGVVREIVAYVGVSDLMYHVLTLAAVKIGHTALLLSPRNNIAAQRHLLRQVRCNVAVIQASAPPSLRDTFCGEFLRTLDIPDLDFFLYPDNPVPRIPFNGDFTKARHSPLVILHSSGSTGLPQPITVNHGTLASMDANQLIPPLTGRSLIGCSLGRSKILMTFPLYHMASFTLLLGLTVYYEAVMVLPPAHVPLTAELVSSIQANARVDGLIVPPSILVDVLDDEKMLASLKRLKFIWFAGGSLPQEVGDKLCKITYLATLFGSTETAFPPHEVLDTEGWAYVKYSPFYGSVMRPYYEDGWFEQVIVRRPELDLFQSVFSTYPELKEFSTGDIYLQHPNQPTLWKFCGRTDDIIVLSNAEKFNPVDYESVVLSHPAVRSALVGGQGKPQTCILLEPKVAIQDEQSRSALLNEIWPTIETANRQSPSYARVMKDFVLFTDSETGVNRAEKGTVQRSPTLDLYLEEIIKLYQKPALPNVVPETLVKAETVQYRDLRDTLIRIISSCTWLSGQLTPTTDLFDVGLDSLQAVSLSKQINAYLMQVEPHVHPVTPRVIYECSTIENLESHLQATAFSSPERQEEANERKMQSIFNDWSSNLPKAVNPLGRTANNDRVVLLTGSRGSLGPNILSQLLSCPHVSKIYCLNRNEGAESLQSRYAALEDHNPEFPTVNFLKADLSSRGLGLSQSAYQKLQSEVTDIIHNAWDVNFNRPLSTFVKPHIAGVRHLIDLFLSSPNHPKLHFISSTSAVDHGYCKVEDTPNPHHISETVPATWSSAQNMGYAQSKLIAERLIEHTAITSGLRAHICRIGQIAGPTTEKGKWKEREWFPSLIASSAKLRKVPESLGKALDIVDWVPVDSVAKIIVELLDAPKEEYPGFEKDLDMAIRRSHQPLAPQPAISCSDSSKPTSEIPKNSLSYKPQPQASSVQVFNIVNPHLSTYRDLLPHIQNHCETQLGVVPFSSWLEALKTAAEDEVEAAELPAIRLLGFWEGILADEQTGGEQKDRLSTVEAVKHSRYMASLTPIGETEVARWMQQWGLGK